MDVMLMKAEEKLQKFKELSLDEKKEKLMAIFEYAKNQIDFSKTAIDYLSSNDAPNELVMQNLYELIVNAVEFSKSRIQMEEEQKKHAKEDFAKKMESSQKSDSEEADKLLDLINLL